MRHLNLEELRQIQNLKDLLQGCINRCCVTDSKAEFKHMTLSAYRKMKQILNIAWERFEDDK